MGYSDFQWGLEGERFWTHPHFVACRNCMFGILFAFFLSSVFYASLSVLVFSVIFTFVLVSFFVWLSISGFVRAFDEYETNLSRRCFAIAAPLIFVLTIFLALPVLWAGLWINTWWTYFSVKSDLVEIYNNPKSETEIRKQYGNQFRVENKGDLKVAFSRGGFLNNWSAIIYDPTHEVSKADGFDEEGGLTAPDHVKSIFGGDLVSCSNIWGHYYGCSFT